MQLTRFIKLFNGLFLILFVGSAGAQLNDPDPWLWIGLYGVAAVFCVGFQLQ